jgi:hypothetical protein
MHNKPTGEFKPWTTSFSKAKHINHYSTKLRLSVPEKHVQTSINIYDIVYIIFFSNGFDKSNLGTRNHYIISNSYIIDIIYSKETKSKADWFTQYVFFDTIWK